MRPEILGSSLQLLIHRGRLQRPLPDGALRIVARGVKEEPRRAGGDKARQLRSGGTLNHYAIRKLRGSKTQYYQTLLKLPLIYRVPMNDEYFKEHAARVRNIASFADPFTKAAARTR